jgi:hypothetical protein
MFLFLDRPIPGVFNFYDYQLTPKQQLEVIGFGENGTVSAVLERRIHATTQANLPLTPKTLPSFLANQTRYKKYMLTNVGGGACGGVGNVIFRVAALYGIGKHLKRNACLQGSCAEEYHVELYSMFPNLQRFPLLVSRITYNLVLTYPILAKLLGTRLKRRRFCRKLLELRQCKQIGTVRQ